MKADYRRDLDFFFAAGRADFFDAAFFLAAGRMTFLDVAGFFGAAFFVAWRLTGAFALAAVSYTHLRAHET